MLRAGKQQQVVGQSDPKAAEQATVASTSPLDQDQVSGDTISQLVGVRIATPFFGTGFNFCVGLATPRSCMSGSDRWGMPAWVVLPAFWHALLS